MIRRLLTALLTAGALVPLLSIGPVKATTTTFVSLTFDDGRATAYSARPILSSHGMHATFYLNSGLLGSYSFWMTWQQVQDLYSDGNEIGGHTAYHANLVTTDPQEAQRQICDDRVNLLNHGYQATSFAYPYGAYNSSIKAMVQACGYSSARTTDYLNGTVVGTPPADPYAFGIGNSSLTLTNLENAVRNAETTGGWVPLMFHDVCNGCSSLAISPANLSSLLDWLQGESGNGVVVQTVGQVMGGPVHAGVAGPAGPAAANGTNGVRNASVETDANGDAAPDCWSFDGYGTNTYAWSRTTDSHSGTYAERVDVSGYSSGDRLIDVTQDLGACTPSVVPGHRYVVKAWYKSTASVYFTFYTRDTNLAFNYWTDSGNFSQSGGWTQAVFTTGVIPANVTGLSFGLAIAGNGSLTVDDLSIDDASASGGPDTTAPVVALTGPANGAILANQATLSATASDNIALDHVDYLVDGQVVGSTVTGPTTLTWNSRNVANGTHTFAARATDTSGNTTTSGSVSATVANQPLVNLLTNNPSLETGGNPPDCWQFGGSQTGSNHATYTHTTDAHSGSFAENIAMDSYSAGDRKLVTTQSQACAPAATGGHAYSVSAWYKSTITAWIYIYYREAVTGNWIFLTQINRPASAGWTQANFTTPTLPSNANKISVGMGLEGIGSLTIDEFAISDASPPPDTTAPTSTITCNNNGTEGTCGTGYYPGSVLIQLAATDDANGTGVASIRYTTDGSDPTASNGNTYSGPFNTTGTVKYRAYDFAGNAEAIHTQVIFIDAAAPMTSASCNGAACSTAPYNAPVSITLDASDTGGSGLASTRYTTDGTDPTASHGTVYSGAFQVVATTTVKYASFDNVGNAEAVHTQLISLDASAPSISLTTPADGATVGGTSVTLSADASDDTAIAGVDFLVDGTVVGSSSTASYSFAWDSTAVAEGSHTLAARATDTAGNATTTADVSVTVDNTAPTVNLTAPADGTTVAGSSVTISADASDGSAVASVDFLVDGAVVGTATAVPYSFTWDSTAVADGSHSVTARATDSTGNVTTSAAETITVDNAGPTVGVTAPADGSTVNGSVEISADASDDAGVGQVEFLIDGSVVSTDSSAPYSYTWDTTSASDGSHTLTARATDGLGNVSTSAGISTAVDNIGPTTALTAPGDGATVAGSSVAITANATDVSGVSQVEFLVDGSVVGTATTAPWTFSWDSTSVGDGTHSLTARATDGLGNVATSAARSVTVHNHDTSAPTVGVTAPADASTVGGTSVTLSANASDDVGVTSVDFLVDGTVVATDWTYPYSMTWDSSTLGDGSHSVAARASDAAGNATTSAVATITVDNTAPTVGLTAPSDGSTVTGASVTLSASASDDAGIAKVEFLVDGNVVATDTSFPYSFSWNSTAVGDGAHSVTARATDAVGNTSTSVARSVTVDNTGPTTALTAPAAGATVSGGAVTISASATDPLGVGQVEFLVDGTVVGTDTSAPYSTSWTSTTVADGAHSLTARATDAGGNVTTSTPLTVTTDNTGPTTSISAPASGASVSGSAVTISATATDGSGVSQVEFLVDGTVVGTDTTAPYSTGWSSTTVADGTHSLTARATDGLGNVRTSAASSITVDNAGPTVALTAPADGATVSGSTVTISGTATDPGGVAKVEFMVDGAVVATDTTSPYSIAWNSSTVAEGSHSLTARATDGLGNIRTSAARTVTVHNAPTVALSAPANGATVSGKNVTVSATASSAFSITKVEFFAGATLIGTDTSSPYSISWNTTSRTDGSYALTARATNSVGLVTTSATRTVTVRNDSTPPSTSVTAPTAGATVSGTAVTISASASDNVGVARVDFFVGATQIGTDSSSPYSITWDSTTVPDGTVSITARATDVNGNATTSAAVSATVRNAPVVTAIVNAGLEADANSDGTPDCWAPGGSGNNTAAYARVTDAHSGSFAERLTMSAYKNGSRTFEIVKDSGACSIAVTAGRSYTLGLWFKSNAAISIVVSYRNSAGTWVSWVTSPTSPASASWAQKTFTTAAVPAGATNLSFGISVASTAVVTMDDFSIAIVP